LVGGNVLQHHGHAASKKTQQKEVYLRYEKGEKNGRRKKSPKGIREVVKTDSQRQ